MPPAPLPARFEPRQSPVGGVLFDKDGTLFGFQATWGGWAADLVTKLARDAPAGADDLAARLRLDLAGRRFQGDSPVIAGTLDDAVGLLLPALPGWSAAGLAAFLVDESRALQPVEAVPLRPLLTRLSAAGLKLGVATNDAEAATLAQLTTVGLEGAFDFVAGADSGYGAKPGPGQCLAFAEAMGLDPARIAMIGDSTHDLNAAQAAGMARVAVLTGVAEAEDLAPFADVVLPDIGALPVWLGLPLARDGT